MDRMACVDIRQLPLQVLLRNKPEWKDLPVAVVDRDTPTGTIFYVNKRGRERRILPGLRYGAGLSLCRDLRGGVVSSLDVGEAIALITQRLWQFSPHVEPAPNEPGIFWLNASGLRHVFASLNIWADAIRYALRDAGFHAVVAVGFTRFGSYAAACSKRENVVFGNADEEYESLRATPIVCLNVDPAARDMLFKLGIERLGKFIDLPRAEIRKRFDPALETLHEMACGAQWRPLLPRAFTETVERTTTLDYPENNAERLLFILAQMLTSILAALSQRHEALKTLHLRFALGNRGEVVSEISPATPTLDSRSILMLLRLRLEQMTLTAGVEELVIRATSERASHHQLELFKETGGHNLRLANDAIAKLRALLNENAIVCGRLHDGHLPEAQYRWEPVRQLHAPQPTPGKTHGIVKRIFSPAMTLPPQSRHEPDGWLIAGLADGPVDENRGPFVISGGWWVQDETARTYYHVCTRSGRRLWIYQDHKRSRWFIHAELQ